MLKGFRRCRCWKYDMGCLVWQLRCRARGTATEKWKGVCAEQGKRVDQLDECYYSMWGVVVVGGRRRIGGQSTVPKKHQLVLTTLMTLMPLATLATLSTLSTLTT